MSVVKLVVPFANAFKKSLKKQSKFASNSSGIYHKNSLFQPRNPLKMNQNLLQIRIISKNKIQMIQIKIDHRSGTYLLSKPFQQPIKKQGISIKFRNIKPNKRYNKLFFCIIALRKKVSNSNRSTKFESPISIRELQKNGPVAEWLGRSLQNFVQRFKSARDLQFQFIRSH